MYGQRRQVRSQCSSRQVSSSEDESLSSDVGVGPGGGAGLFSHLVQDDEDAFYEECEGGGLTSLDETTGPRTADTNTSRNPRTSSSSFGSVRSSKTLSDAASFTSFAVGGPEMSSPTGQQHQDIIESEREFMKYVMSLPSDRSEPSEVSMSLMPAKTTTSTKASNKVGLDHLDNLCKLLEQLGDLRTKNQKLERRVEYLEGLRMLHDMYKTSVVGEESARTDVVKDVKKVGGNNGHSGSYRKNKTTTGRSKYKLRSTGHSRARNRSKSVGHEDIGGDAPVKTKSSKWSKMKEALGLKEQQQQQGDDERLVRAGVQKSHTCNGVFVGELTPPSPLPFAGSDRSRPDSVLSEDSSVPEENELKIKEEMDRLSASPVPQTYYEDRSTPLPKGSQLLEIPGDARYNRQSSSSPSSANAIESHHHSPSSKNTPKGSGGKYVDKDGRKYKSAWGKVRDIIHTRKDSLKQKKGPGNKKSVSSEQIEVDPSSGISVEISTVSEDESCKRTIGEHGGGANTEEEMRKLSMQSEPGPRRTLSTETWYDHSGDSGVVDIDTRGRQRTRHLAPSSPNSKKRSMNLNLVPHQYGGLGVEQERISPSDEPQCLLVRSNSYSGPKGNETELEISTKAIKPEKEDELEVGDGLMTNKPGSNRFSAISSVTAPTFNLEDLQRNLSYDFSKKMEAWEKLKAKEGYSKTQTPTGDRKQEQIISKFAASDLGSTRSSGSQRKDKSPKARDQSDKSPKHKEREKALQWVEKELQKIDKEKQRLTKEKQKFQEREERLEKLKGSMLKPQEKPDQDILIKTSAGEFRFGGISKSFTKRLYEWEEKQGVNPELSTIALLSSSVKEVPQGTGHVQDGSGSPTMKKSRSETSLQSSHNSSLYSLEEKRGVFSTLSTSEPHLSSPEDQPEPPFISKVTSYSPEEVTSLIDGDSIDACCTSTEENQCVMDVSPDVTKVTPPKWFIGGAKNRADDMDDCNYLWDENMSLLERLKMKESECKQLETQLTNLDCKLEEMTSQHNQEVECYKSKLHETQKSLFDKSKDIPRSAIELAEELKSNVEQLDTNLDFLKQERQQIQSTFASYREEQNFLAENLVSKMQQLHKINATGKDENETETSIEDPKEMKKIKEITSQLVQQAKDLEECMSDRSELIGKLRWQVLDRCVSNMKLKTEVCRLGGDYKKRRKEQYQTWSTSHGLLATPDIVNDTRDKERLATIMYKGELSTLPSQIAAKMHELQLELLKFQRSSAKKVRRKSKERLGNGAKEYVDGATETTRMPATNSDRYVRRRLPRQTRVSKASSPPPPRSPLSSSESRQDGESIRVDMSANTANKHKTSISSGHPLGGAANTDVCRTTSGTVLGSSCRNISRDESLGIGCRHEKNEPIAIDRKLRKSLTDPDKLSANLRRLELKDTESGIPVYTLYVPTSKAGETLPEVTCTLSLNPADKPKPKSKQSGKNAADLFVNACLKSPQSPRSQKSPKDEVLKEPRLNVRQLAAQYDRKVTELQSPKSDRRNVSDHDRKTISPMSPATRARMAKLRRAKDEFLARPTSPEVVIVDAEDNSSVSSACEAVMRRTGENCRETRRRTGGASGAQQASRRTPADESRPQQPIAQSAAAAKSSSFFNIRLRKNKKKKTSTTAETAGESKTALTALCRQSLYVDVAEKEGLVSPGPRSCPASPEMKAKSGTPAAAVTPTTAKTKPNWLQRLKPK